MKDIPIHYKIRIKGELNRDWENIFPGFKVSTERDQENGIIGVLVGEIIDQPQLYGIFSKMRDMGCVILDVNQIESEKKDGRSSKNNE
mgnify:CR=1 FL=1